MVTYILIIILYSGFSAPTIHHIEFESKNSCEIAKAAIQKDFNQTKVYCILNK